MRKILEPLNWEKMPLKQVPERLKHYREQGYEAFLDGDAKAICVDLITEK